LKENHVAIARSRAAGYGVLEEPAACLRALFHAWGLEAANPLGALIRPGSRVVLKPNWVHHYNQSGQGLDCLITHPTLIEAVLEAVELTRPASVVVGDAPLQGCDFAELRRLCRLDEMAERFRRRGLPVEIADFRRTVLPEGRLGARRQEALRSMDRFVLFDLQQHSLLEALAADSARFRVTMYNPDLLLRTHAPGRHQYLIAREIIEADVVVNLPKLKSHKKACLTGALKNLIGINGNKEYLPHHRKGGSRTGGDCYPGRSRLKGMAENFLDAANRTASLHAQSLLAGAAAGLARCARLLGEQDPELEGSWYGNDTIWRTCLDLQRILRYGKLDGSLASTPQRTVITITDAIVGGEGEGPLANTPVPSRFLTAGLNPAAVEWIHARLMGFDPTRIPLVREAFGSFPFPLASFPPSSVVALLGGERKAPEQVYPFDGRAFLPPSGWRGHCELEPRP
jgi:uncharacterized protein (DUF362 family)